MSAAGFSASSSAARGLFQYNSTNKKEKYHLHHGKKIPFQFSSINSTTSHSGGRPHLAHQGSSSVSSTHSISSLTSSMRRPAQATHFYIPGEVEGPYPVSAFPTVKHVHQLSIDGGDEVRDNCLVSSNVTDEKGASVHHQRSGSDSDTFTLWKSITSSKLWNFISTAFKKGQFTSTCSLSRVTINHLHIYIHCVFVELSLSLSHKSNCFTYTWPRAFQTPSIVACEACREGERGKRERTLERC